MMDILLSETCWAHKKWSKITSDIKFVFSSSWVTFVLAYPIEFSFRQVQRLKLSMSEERDGNSNSWMVVNRGLICGWTAITCWNAHFRRSNLKEFHAWYTLMLESDNNLIPAQSFMLMINFLYKLVFRLIAFDVLLDGDCPFAKPWHTDTQTDVNRCGKKACCFNSNQFILCGVWGRAVNTMLINHYHTFPLSVVKSEHKLYSNVECSYDIYRVRQWIGRFGNGVFSIFTMSREGEWCCQVAWPWIAFSLIWSRGLVHCVLSP